MSSELEEEQKAIEALRKDGYSETVIDHWLNPRNLKRVNRKECDGFSDWFTVPVVIQWKSA
jgi:hypothetical protein